MNIYRNLFANARMEIVKIRHARNHVIINGEIMNRNKIFGALPDSARWRNLNAARVKTRRMIAPVIDTAEIRRKHKWGGGGKDCPRAPAVAPATLGSRVTVGSSRSISAG